MRNMDALVRLARFKVEGLQAQVSELDEARARLEGQIEKLEASVPGEQVAATANRDGFVAYGSYAQSVIQRKQNLRVSIDEVDAQAVRLREELEEAFRELKKYEVLEERRAADARAERAKREQAAMDEAASRAAG